MTSYHDLYITTESISRTRIFDLPFAFFVHCCRSAGWELWRTDTASRHTLIAGEFDEKWLILDVNGVEICNSKPPTED